ncbi:MULTISPECIES: dTDP-4-dehydrorhamnose 3,5-epimerase [Loigolactobacillus]|uniref:dTDP-4-dehydrorhamnose 3,5-epimerase n=1 Tax=Loigolactobacillus backii TaxID=375175 RepID=A0A192GXS2_9LACO|nr:MULTISPECIES: dTDP-4-dehydrorhamnose 3,5-epimerase [Loigolactobacillus]ANK59016.1 dTDP-4-dehydrorhamnose 3,5-epimerase [Loigolactobacillus backii]ANK61314.1 dTDP-4-dehydrorhamnose 3,5-epimerase [Loigolactobacillus backii]ANK64004.1 dTDP-4-dehydrorhamnose 3,5-epimerase [Loigolactobacillus backii]ANK69486.1 dTDP-4-dehydrorhamnose 3,5-epimerase [Loigolactobacillus backii]MDA5388139.1 dTDP-4-dehydrorhamnose 3,5-epimerase [Loigolactobacillus backii]
MKVIDTKLTDAKIIETDVFGDHRGFFTETFTANKFKAAGVDVEWLQDNQSLSVEPGVLRGMHFQRAPHAQTKLLRAITGVIYDVIIDVRTGSPTYGQWQGFILSEFNHRQLLVPKGFAHGFMTLTANCNVAYKCDGYYAPDADGGLAYDDPDIGIEWPMPLDDLVLSEKDKHHPRLKDADLNFVYGGKN